MIKEVIVPLALEIMELVCRSQVFKFLTRCIPSGDAIFSTAIQLSYITH
jgi:hypothetical protein